MKWEYGESLMIHCAVLVLLLLLLLLSSFDRND
jgi:hypothetical protein